MASDYIYSIGVNTGNSLDAADAVLTCFGLDGSIRDIDSVSQPMPGELAEALRAFRTSIMEKRGDMPAAILHYDNRSSSLGLKWAHADQLITAFTVFAADTVNQLKDKLVTEKRIEEPVDLIGFHGQTCAHQPPSIAGSGSTYTIQIGNGQLLADLTNTTVVYDFRSDDLMNGGEAAPLAPVHHEHLAHSLAHAGRFPIAFCNAGNTGNISVITEDSAKNIRVSGWDVGPFNDFPDKLMQAERGLPCDLDGNIGKKGSVKKELLRLLFDKSALTDSGENFLLQAPPKSSDPQWYRIIPALAGQSGNPFSFEDRIHAAEYFAAYVFFYSLKWIPDEHRMPRTFALCGGGWNNPVARGQFEKLLRGNQADAVILDEHSELFCSIQKRISAEPSAIEIGMADEFGFSGQFMEARLFADAAVKRIMAEPFSRPETTGCKSPSILGLICFPQSKKENATPRIREWLARYDSMNAGFKADLFKFDPRWSRASGGWEKFFSKQTTSLH